MSKLMGILKKGTIAPQLLESFVSHQGNDTQPGRWGVAGYLGNWTVRYGAGDKPVAEEKQQYEAACGHALLAGAKILIAHLHHGYTESSPLIKNNWLFCNSGVLIETENPVHGEPCGSAQAFFSTLVEKLDQRSTKAYPSLIYDLVEYWRSHCQMQFFSFVVSDGRHLIAYRDSRDHEGLAALFCSVSEDAFLVCSQKLPGGEWKEIKKGEVVVVDRHEVIHGLQ